MRNIFKLFLALVLSADIASAATNGTVFAGQGPSLSADYIATPTLGVNATTTGSLGLANGNTTGKTVTIKNTSATAANYNFNLPSTAGTSGQMLISGGGGSSAMTWSSSPTFTSPVLGNATATTLNKYTFTTPATGSTLTIADGKTLTANNTLTLAGTDSTTITFPGTSDTVAGIGTAQTWTAVQTITNSDLAILGSSTGKTTITSDNAGASNFTMHLPAANDTLVTLAASQTLTSKTLTAPVLNNPVITGPAPVACGASCSPTAGMLSTITVNSGGTATLPTSSGSGNVIRFRVMITQTSGTIKVLLTTTSDVIIGTAIGENAGTAKVFVGNAATNHSIAMPFAGTQPSGGFAGDQITCTDMATGTWACDINYQAGTTPTTPYSTSTS